MGARVSVLGLTRPGGVGIDSCETLFGLGRGSFGIDSLGRRTGTDSCESMS